MTLLILSHPDDQFACDLFGTLCDENLDAFHLTDLSILKIMIKGLNKNQDSFCDRASYFSIGNCSFLFSETTVVNFISARYFQNLSSFEEAELGAILWIINVFSQSLINPPSAAGMPISMQIGHSWQLPLDPKFPYTMHLPSWENDLELCGGVINGKVVDLCDVETYILSPARMYKKIHKRGDLTLLAADESLLPQEILARYNFAEVSAVHVGERVQVLGLDCFPSFPSQSSASRGLINDIVEACRDTK